MNFFYFFFTVFLAFYIPGAFLLKRFKFDFLTNTFFSIGLGIVLWAYQGFIFGFLHTRSLSYIYLIIFGFLWTKAVFFDKKPKFPKFDLSKSDLLLWLIIFVGVAIQLSFTFLMGLKMEGGMYFCCGLPDSLYHIGLTSSLVNNFPPFEPAMSGIIVKNYHYLSNLVEADLIRVFHLPLIQTQYQYFPLLISTLLGFFGIAISRILKLGRAFSFFFLLFLFFWGDITYILAFIAGKGFNFQIPFLYDSTALWFSPPRAFGALISFAGIGLLVHWFKKNSIYLTIILSLIFGSLAGFKIYNAAFVFIGLFSLSLYYFYKKDFQKLLLPILSFIFSLFIYLPVNNQASGFYFTGLWRFENFIVQPGFGLSHLELAKQIFLDHKNYLRVIEYESIYIFSYFIFVFGTLNLGWFQTRKSLRMFPKELNIFLICGIFVSLIIGFFFFQKISGSNTSQFIITSEIIGIFYAALVCSIIFQKFKKFKFVFICLLLLFTAPRVIDSTRANYNMQKGREGFLVDSSELSALNYIKNNTARSSLILADNRRLKIEKTCYYVGFLSNRSLFLCDSEGILRDHGANVDQRSKVLRTVVKNFNSDVSSKLLLENKIDYIYTTSGPEVFASDSNILKTVFLNDRIRIIQVKRKE